MTRSLDILWYSRKNGKPYFADEAHRRCAFCGSQDNNEDHDEINETWQQWQCFGCAKWNDK